MARIKDPQEANLNREQFKNEVIEFLGGIEIDAAQHLTSIRDQISQIENVEYRRIKQYINTIFSILIERRILRLTYLEHYRLEEIVRINGLAKSRLEMLQVILEILGIKIGSKLSNEQDYSLGQYDQDLQNYNTQPFKNKSGRVQPGKEVLIRWRINAHVAMGVLLKEFVLTREGKGISLCFKRKDFPVTELYDFLRHQFSGDLRREIEIAYELMSLANLNLSNDRLLAKSYFPGNVESLIKLAEFIAKNAVGYFEEA